MSAKTVIVSAARTIGLRHSAWLRRSMAEIITPAWLMPTQKMKLVMKKPQKTGCWRPVTPSPWFIIKPKALAAPATMIPRTETMTTHHIGVLNTTSRSSRLICASVSVLRWYIAPSSVFRR